MFSELKKVVQENANTQKVYRANVKKCFELLTENNIFTIPSALKLYDILKNKGYKLATLRTYIKCFYVMLQQNEGYDMFYDGYLSIMKMLQDDIEKISNENINDIDVIKFSEVEKLRDTLKKSSIEYLLLSLFSFIPPRRISDYQLMKVVKKYSDTLKSDTEYNYYCLENATFYYNNYKTFKQYGHVQKKLSSNNENENKLIETINFWLSANVPSGESYDGIFLFIGEYSSNAITKKLLKLFTRKLNKPVSINHLRHSFITSYYEGKQMNEVTNGEILELSKNMAHSINENLKYRKISNE